MPAREYEMKIMQNIIKLLKEHGVDPNRIMIDKRVNLTEDQIDAILHQATMITAKQCNVRIPGKYSGQEEVVKEYEAKCNYDYFELLKRKASNEFKNKISAKEIDEVITQQASFELGIDFDRNGDFNRFNFRMKNLKDSFRCKEIWYENLRVKMGERCVKEILKKMNWLMYYKAKINYHGDESCLHEKHADVNNTSSFVFGANFEIVYHKQMSLNAINKTLG